MSIFANKKDLEVAQSQIKSLSNDLATAQSELTAERETVAAHALTITDLQSQIAALTAERDKASESLTEASGKIETLQEAVKTAEASAEQRAVEMLAQHGHGKPVEIEERDEIKAMTRAQFNALTPRQKTDFSKNGGKII